MQGNADRATFADYADFAAEAVVAETATFADNAENAGKIDGFTVGVDVPANAKFTDTVVDISGKADKVLPYTQLTGATVTVSPSGSYVWETTAGTNLLNSQWLLPQGLTLLAL